jgi:hypothetical protein
LDPGRPNLDNDSFAVQGGQDRLSQGVTTLVNRLLKGEQRRDAMHFLILQYLEACDMNSAKSAEEGLRKEMETNRKNCAVQYSVHLVLFRIPKSTVTECGS